MFKEYWDSFDCEINSDEMIPDWYDEYMAEELSNDDGIYCELESILIHEENIPFQEKHNNEYNNR